MIDFVVSRVFGSLAAIFIALVPYPWLQPPPTTFLFKVAGHTATMRSGLSVFARDGSGIGLIAHVDETSPQTALAAILTETNRYLGAAPDYGPVAHDAPLEISTTTFQGRFADADVRGTITVQGYDLRNYVGIVLFDRPERFEISAPRMLRTVRVIEYVGPW